MSENILVICEQRDGILQKVSMELIGKGRELAAKKNQKVIALLMGHQIEKEAQTLVNYGADKVVYVDDTLLKDYMTEPAAKATCAVIKDLDPDIVLIGATSIGRDLAPRVAARVKTGLTADCTYLEVDDDSGDLLMTRPAFGGNLMATIVCPNHRPQMATVRPGVMIACAEEQRSGEIVKFDAAFNASDANVVILETVMATKEAKDITEAKVLVAGGRGIGKSDNYVALKELADVLGGETAASRAAVDLGYVDKDRQVGQTGKTVRPDVYFACGISGAIQHVAGMEESELIFAINKNADAPIFEVADVGIVGDMHKIVPKLVARLKKEMA